MRLCFGEVQDSFLAFRKVEMGLLKLSDPYSQIDLTVINGL